MAGWRIPWANEFIPAARETYEANWPETYVDPRDIREIEPGDILDRIGLDDLHGDAAGQGRARGS